MESNKATGILVLLNVELNYTLNAITRNNDDMHNKNTIQPRKQLAKLNHDSPQ